MTLTPFSPTWRLDLLRAVGNVSTVSPFMATVLDDPDAATARTTLGLGSAAVEDYSTGTWTPTVTLGTPGTFSATYSSQGGNFVQVGDMVHVSCILNFTPTIGTGTGSLLFQGLPFPMFTGVEAFAFRNMTGGWVWPASRTMVTFGAAGTTNVIMVGQGSGGSGVVFGVANMTDGVSHSFQFAGAYRKS